MKTIKNNAENILTINNSKFICNLYKVYSYDEVLKYLELTKQKYKDATHYCYGYIIDKDIKASDDNEPSGTAATPIKEVLTKNNLNYILCIVTRYFGGIKLGASGLIRAYTKSVALALKEDNIATIVKGTKMTITFPYNISKEIDYILKNEKIINKKYKDKVTYTFTTINKDIILNLTNNKDIIINEKKDMNIEI